MQYADLNVKHGNDLTYKGWPDSGFTGLGTDFQLNLDRDVHVSWHPTGSDRVADGTSYLIIVNTYVFCPLPSIIGPHVTSGAAARHRTGYSRVGRPSHRTALTRLFAFVRIRLPIKYYVCTDMYIRPKLNRVKCSYKHLIN